MENYAEDLNHNNCFWANFDSLKSYIDSKYIEYKIIGEIFKSLSNAIKIFYKNLKNF